MVVSRTVALMACTAGVLLAASATAFGITSPKQMRPNSWWSVPKTHLRDVAPSRAKYPRIQARMGVKAVVANWSGGAFDTRRSRLIVWGGGHNGYGGNEIYAFNVDSLKWERLTDPTPNPVNGPRAQVNPDGTPNSRHTYNGLACVAHADRFFASGGAVHALDPSTSIWTAYQAPGAPRPTKTGIYGRWQYVPGLDVFILVTSVDEDVHFYKMPRLGKPKTGPEAEAGGSVPRIGSRRTLS